jgi:hypothetical protein
MSSTIVVGLPKLSFQGKTRQGQHRLEQTSEGQSDIKGGQQLALPETPSRGLRILNLPTPEWVGT